MISSENPSVVLQALLQAQAKFPPIQKRGYNPHFKSHFATLADTKDACDGILREHGLGVVQFPAATVDGKPALTTILAHESGEYVGDTTPLSQAKQDPQAQGSAITYLRRYSYSAALGLVTEDDDDGNSASQPDTKALEAAHERVKEAAGRLNMGKSAVEQLWAKKFETPLSKTVDVAAVNALADKLVEMATAKELA